MEILTEPTIAKTPNPAKTANSEQLPQISGAGDGKAGKAPIPDLYKKGGGRTQLENSKYECKTPTRGEKTEEKQRILVPKNGTPNRLKLPTAFKYPERYSSPTDLVMSPISKGLLARTRKGAVPSKLL